MQSTLPHHQSQKPQPHHQPTREDPTTLPRHPDEERYFKSGAKRPGALKGAGSGRLRGGEAKRASSRRYARAVAGLRARPFHAIGLAGRDRSGPRALVVDLDEAPGTRRAPALGGAVVGRGSRGRALRA
jgi:hypothetical protein